MRSPWIRTRPGQSVQPDRHSNSSFSGFLLITGSPVLTTPITTEPSLPAGTLITWAGMISLPLSIYLGFHPFRAGERFLAIALKLFIILAVLWAPLSYLLAGNLSFSFSEKAGFQGGQTAMRLFWYFNYTLATAPILLFLLFGLIRVLKK